MEKLSLNSLDTRVKVLEGRMTGIEQDLSTVKAHTETIVDVVTHTKTATQWAKRIAPPLITFLIGAGWLNPQLGAAFRAMLGG